MLQCPASKFYSFMAWYDTVVDFGLGLGQSLFNNHLSEQSAQKQHQRQLDFWNKQNAYNNPAAQRQRFNAAGMNPAAVTGQIASSGSAQGLSSVPGNDFAKKGALNLPSYVESLRSLEEIENISAQTNSVTADVARKLLENVLIETFGYSQAEAEAKSAEFDAKMKESKYNNYETEFQAFLENLKSGTNKNNAEAVESGSRAAYNDALTATENALRDLRVEYEKASIGEIVSRSELNKSQSSLNDALTRYNNNKDSREAQMLLIESFYKAALTEAAQAASNLDDALTKKAVKDVRLASNKDAREAALHVYDLMIAEANASGAFSDAQIKALKAYRDKLKSGDVDNLGEFANGVAFLIADFIGLNL